MMDTGYVQLDVPHGWETIQQDGATIIAAPAANDGFRPNISIATEPATAASVAGEATHAVAASLAMLERVHVISYEIWPFPGGEGRRIEYSHEMEGMNLYAQHWLLLEHGFLTRFTATCRTTQLPACDPVFDSILRSVVPAGAQRNDA